MNGDGNYAWFYSGIFISKGLWSATLSQGHKKSYWITEDLIWRFLTRRNLFVFPCIPKGVFVGRFTQTKFTVNFHLFIQYKNAGQHIQSNSKSFQAKAITKFTSLQQENRSLDNIIHCEKQTRGLNFTKRKLSCCNDEGKSPTFLYVRRWQIG